MKTGYTEAAGHCLIASGTRPGRDIIVVVLGDSKVGVWRDAAALLFWGFGCSLVTAVLESMSDLVSGAAAGAPRSLFASEVTRDRQCARLRKFVIVGQQLVNFSSNDYLGLANDPRLREAATAAIAEFGVGAGCLPTDQRHAIAARASGDRARPVERNRSGARL